ncbi:hypothetical protein Poli38472_002703 [Pythium oligandrum]|uniref:Ubiquitinyl hydrolase 1 n=1 Tax=Pythium oligandrum TaxID=41045 RepID=A0A8K1CK77_PYTOL|nr:hypothetical protein Poli38472_002703 [Pythium oligandrum]|eukprot:TMW63762.1 hypothetical protein Poli38472_002703 [Pythium oligandrum]
MGVSRTLPPPRADAEAVSMASSTRLSSRRGSASLARLWPFRPSKEARRRDAYPDHNNARRLRRLDAWTLTELQVLQMLVEHATETSEVGVDHHPFNWRQREMRTTATTVSKTAKMKMNDELAVMEMPKKHLQFDYPAWRRRYLQEPIDRRLRLRRKAFLRLFPSLTVVPNASLKRIFHVFDRNHSNKVEFTELCETLARCTGRDGSRARVGVLCEWFIDSRVQRITRDGIELLDATYQALLAQANGRSTTKKNRIRKVQEELLQGNSSVSIGDFRDRILRLPELVATLFQPFDIVDDAINEKRLLDDYAQITWREGDTAYVVAKDWWDMWSDHVTGVNLSPGPVDNQQETEEDGTTIVKFTRVGAITNASLCEDAVNGILRPNLLVGVDFVLVTSAIWRTLYLLHGGGPELPRRVVASSNQEDPTDTPTDSAESRLTDLTSEGRSTVSSYDFYTNDSVTIQETNLRVLLYPLRLQLRVMKTTGSLTTIVLARYLLISPNTTLKELLHRLGLFMGVNMHDVSFWKRRHRFGAWRRIECSIDAPRSSFRHLHIRHMDEFLIDFRPLMVPTDGSGSDCIADDPLSLVMCHSAANDLLCSAFDSVATSRGLATLQRTARETKTSLNGYLEEGATMGVNEFGHGGVVTSNGFFESINEQLRLKHRALPRLVAHRAIRATGLVNLGNTCFLNCALQCVGHSPVLREYFLSQRFLSDINKTNTLGTKGKVAAAYGRLMEKMWSQFAKSSYMAPELFRDEFTYHRPHFQESNQHDAHEFIVSLLDALHEDLNRKQTDPLNEREGSLCLPYYGGGSFSGSVMDDLDDFSTSSYSIASSMPRGSSGSTGSKHTTVASSSDAAIGSMSWQAHARVNSSIIVDLFHGQMRSETVCGSCEERKVAFDPFLFFSVPIPEPKYIRVEVRVVLQVRPSATEPTTGTRITRRGLWLPRKSTITGLRSELGSLFDLPPKRFLLVEVRRHRIKRIFDDVEPVDSVGPYVDLYAYERAWALEDIPSVPTDLIDKFRVKDNGVDETSSELSSIREYEELHIGSRVDALGFHGDWHQGTVVDMTEGSDDADPKKDKSASPSSSNSAHVLVHFDAFSSKWDKWFSYLDWVDGTLMPPNSKVSPPVEVFEVQVIHRYFAKTEDRQSRHSLQYHNGKIGSRVGRPPSAPRENWSLEIFGVPMFVTVTSDSTSQGLHDAILLQATRCFEVSSESTSQRVPYDVRIVDLDDASSAMGTFLPKDSSRILQHFSKQSVVVLDWKDFRTYSLREQHSRDYMPEGMLTECDENGTLREQGAPPEVLSNSTSLSQCLDALFQDEAIPLDDHWMCERCGQQRAGTRRSDVWKLPDLVMVQLKRFQYQENGYRQKVRTVVDFPLRGLDFSRWVGASSPTASSHDPDSYVYDLYGVVNHVGGLARGHYTAHCRYDGDFEESARVFANDNSRSHGDAQFDDLWMRFDDEKVVEIAPGDVITDAAYVLFYKRRKISAHNLIAYAL